MLKDKNKHRVQFTITLSDEDIKLLNDTAEREYLTRPAFVRQLVLKRIWGCNDEPKSDEETA